MELCGIRNVFGGRRKSISKLHRKMRGDRKRHLGDGEESFSEFPRISRGLDPVGAKKLAPTGLLRGFTSQLERGQKLFSKRTTIVAA